MHIVIGVAYILSEFTFRFAFVKAVLTQPIWNGKMV